MKIENSKPFEEYDCYLNFHKGMKRWQVCLVSKTKNRRTILYSKFLMSIKEGRILTADEEVDHINGDRSDDRLENLEIVTRKENRARQSANSSRTMVTLLCPYCKKEFTRERRQTHLVKGGARTFCSRNCVAEQIKMERVKA